MLHHVLADFNAEYKFAPERKIRPSRTGFPSVRRSLRLRSDSVSGREITFFIKFPIVRQVCLRDDSAESAVLDHDRRVEQRFCRRTGAPTMKTDGSDALFSAIRETAGSAAFSRVSLWNRSPQE